jgi:hypothetical protein
VDIADLKATLAGGLAALFAAGQAIAAEVPANDDEASLLQQEDDGSDDEEKDGHNHHPRGRGGRPSGYRHDRDPNVRDSNDEASDSSDDSESTDEETAPSDGDAPPAEDGSAPADAEPAPAEGNGSADGGAAPVVDDASGGDNIQEGIMAPAASPVPSSAAAPIAVAPTDVDFMS